MVITNLIHPKFVNLNLFTFLCYKTRGLYMESVYEEYKESFSLHRIKFQFNYQRVKVTRMQFPLLLA